jgi:hypothetical protein
MWKKSFFGRDNEYFLKIGETNERKRIKIIFLLLCILDDLLTFSETNKLFFFSENLNLK